MAVDPFLSSRRLQPPFVHASPFRYSALDTTADSAALRNRQPSWFGLFVPFVAIDSDRLEVIGHDSTSTGRDAEFYDDTSTAAPPPDTSAAEQYETTSSTPPSATVELKHIEARVNLRSFAKGAQSGDYDQRDFQKRAAEFAIRALWEEAAMVGDSAAGPEMDGLSTLVSNGYGTSFAATANQLVDLDTAMQAIKSHNRRVDLFVMNQDAWKKLRKLERDEGYRPDTRYNESVGCEISYWAGVPICISDHIPTVSGAGLTSSIYCMTLGEPNGVFAIVNEKRPGIAYDPTQDEARPFESISAHFYSALVSTTSDALVEIQNWDVLI